MGGSSNDAGHMSMGGCGSHVNGGMRVTCQSGDAVVPSDPLSIIEGVKGGMYVPLGLKEGCMSPLG
jgi:hypothetical protein